MATNHLRMTFEGLIRTLEESEELQGVLVGDRVFPFYAQSHSGHYVENGKLAIQLLLGDSEDEEAIHNEKTGTDLIPTQVALICDTKLGDDRRIWVNEDGDSLLDLEYKVLRALQSATNWNAAGHHQGWAVDGIERDSMVVTETGEEDPDVRRFVITLIVDVYLDRTDGPGR